MEALCLDQKIILKISQHIQHENIVNSCVEKFHSDKNIETLNKRDFFNKCVQTKINLYEQIDNNLRQ